MGKDFLPTSLPYKRRRKRDLSQKELSCPNTVFSFIVSAALILEIFNMGLTTQSNMIPTHHTFRWSRSLPDCLAKMYLFQWAMCVHSTSIYWASRIPVQGAGAGHLSRWSVFAVMSMGNCRVQGLGWPSWRWFPHGKEGTELPLEEWEESLAHLAAVSGLVSMTSLAR